MRIFRLNILPMIFIIMLGGCFNHPQTILTQNEKDEMKVKTIAVLPVENKDNASKAAQLLRYRLFEEIYFKGYSKISLREIDGKLESLRVNSDQGKKDAVEPEKLKDILNADAVLHCTLSEKNKTGIFYAPVEVNVVCALRRTDDGKIIWQAESETKSKNFDITRKRLEKKISEDYDVLINEVIRDLMKTLPDGPNFRS